MDEGAHRKAGEHMAQTHQHIRPQKARRADVGTGAPTQTHKDVDTLRCEESAKTVGRAGNTKADRCSGGDVLPSRINEDNRLTDKQKFTLFIWIWLPMASGFTAGTACSLSYSDSTGE